MLDLVEHDPVEGHRDQRVEPVEGYDVDAALALAGRRDAVRREQPQDLVGQLVGIAVLHLEDARLEIVEHVAVEGRDQLAQAIDVGLQVGDDEQIRARVGEHVAARRDEGLEDVHHLVGRDVLHRHHLDGERVLLREARLRGPGARDDGPRLRLGDGQDLVDVAHLHGGDAVVAQDLVQERPEVLARDLARRADGDLALDARVDRVADAERGGEAVDHLADVGALEVEDHRLFLAERGLAGRLVGGARRRRRRVLRARGRGGDGGRQQDREHPSPLHGTLLGSHFSACGPAACRSA